MPVQPIGTSVINTCPATKDESDYDNSMPTVKNN